MRKHIEDTSLRFYCPTCKADRITKVTDSRWSANRIRRRRECLTCRKRISTIEVSIDDKGYTKIIFPDRAKLYSLFNRIANDLTTVGNILKKLPIEELDGK